MELFTLSANDLLFSRIAYRSYLPASAGGCLPPVAACLLEQHEQLTQLLPQLASLYTAERT
jgi:hypothetical protein